MILSESVLVTVWGDCILKNVRVPSFKTVGQIYSEKGIMSSQ